MGYYVGTGTGVLGTVCLLATISALLHNTSAMRVIRPPIDSSTPTTPEPPMDRENGIYTVVGPSKLRPDSDYHVAVTGTGLKQPTVMTVRVGDQSGQHSLSKQLELPVADSAQNLQLPIPADWPESGNYTLNVEASHGGVGSGDGSKQYRQNKSLEFQQKSRSVFIQTDKAMYKPGQLVQFRVIVVDPRLRPTVNTSVDIYIKDSKGNRIKQWLKSQPTTGLISGYDLQLSEQPMLGDWTIVAELAGGSGGQRFQKTFTVAEYVLPTFDVTVQLPPYATYKKSDILATVKAIYTYGRPVKGEATLTVQRKDQHYYYYGGGGDSGRQEQPKYQTKVKLGSGGTAGSVDIPVNIVRDLQIDANNQNYEQEIEFRAEVEDELSGRRYNRTAVLKVYTNDVKVDLVKTSQTFKPGLNYTAYLRVAYRDDTPVEDNPLQPLIFKYRFSYDEWEVHQQELPVLKGVAIIDLIPPPDKDIFRMHAEYRGQSYNLEDIRASKSPSNSYLQVQQKQSTGAKQVQPKVGDDLTFVVNSTEPLDPSVSLVYQIMGRGDILATNTVPVVAANQRSVEFSVKTTSKMSPNARLIVYYIRPANSELVADALNFNVDGVFETPVSVSTDVQTTKPGAQVQIRVDSKPRAVVGVLGVDQSVMLLKSGFDVSRDDVIAELKSYDTIQQQSSGSGGSGGGRWSYWRPGSTTTGEMFDDSGVVVLTNGHIHRPEPRHYYHKKGGKMRAMVARPMANARHFNKKLTTRTFVADDDDDDTGADNYNSHNNNKKQSIKVRQKFPETWLWMTTNISGNGTAVINSAIPDTITSWFISAFAIDDDTGLGIAANSAKVTVFRPFFIQLSLPYSIIRGETVALQAQVFNYQSKPMQAVITMDNQKQEFRFTDAPNEVSATDNTTKSQSLTIPANDGVAVKFVITPTRVGYIDIKLTATSDTAGDAIVKKLLVKPEGQTQYFNKAVLVDLRNNASAGSATPEKRLFKRSLALTVPEDAVTDSAKVSVSATGDIMGPTVNNLDDLLRMPYGCGEQNMLNFVPNIVVLDYLTKAGLLTDAIKSKALKHIESGYQRELTYKRDDGSYSAFGKSDSAGSTWLTAFVIKSFLQARGKVEMDNQSIKQSIDWLLRQQLPDGSFNETGVVLHKDMKGGSAESSPVLSAYVLIAILHDDSADNLKLRESVIQKTVQLLAREVQSSDNPYDVALMTYALHLANSTHKDQAFGRLTSLAQKSPDYMWWQESAKSSNTTGADQKKSAHFSLPKSYDVEMTSYALLVLVARDDIESAVPVLRWLISKQNAQGGFASTQDTVIGIQALGALASRVASDGKTSMQLKYQFGNDGGEARDMAIDAQNAIVLQRLDLPSSVRSVDISAEGQGSAIVQLSYQYNLATASESPAFALTAKLDNKSTDNFLYINVCTHYLDGLATNMAVIDAELPSGFVADLEKLDDIRKVDSRVKRVETQKGDTQVILYFDKITADEICVQLPAQRTHRIANPKPVPVQVYDYYNRQKAARVVFEPKPVAINNLIDL